MTTKIVDEIRAALHSEPRLTPGRQLDLTYADRTLTIEGDVRDIAVKKLLLERAAAHHGVDGIIDRLHVIPAQPMGDGEIRDHLRDAMLQESALAEFDIFVQVSGRLEAVRELREAARGSIRIFVDDGIVTLSGEVLSLAHKRLAGVLAWWIPGSRDVVNGLDVLAREADTGAEITDAVRLALEKNPFVNASQIRVSTDGSTVRLQGLVPTDSEREMAEFDAWYVFGVDRVTNEIEVRPVEPSGQAD